MRRETRRTLNKWWPGWYVQQDANYNITSVTDAAGAVLERYVYDAYGERQVLNADLTPKAGNQSTVDNRHGFQGGRHSTEHDLVHFRYRDLHVTLGRWNREDPLGYVDGASVYTYLGENTVSGRVDPRGEWWFVVVIVIYVIDSLAEHASAPTPDGPTYRGVAGGTGPSDLLPANRGIRAVETGLDCLESLEASLDGSGGGSDGPPTNKGRYGHLPNPRDAGPGRETTRAQRRRILDENRRQNDGQLRDDETGELLTPPAQCRKGISRDANEAQVDHMLARSKNGSSENHNLQVIGGKRNREKGNR
jgi:RHS repeat-associated protein